jgi:hypothetical protein
LTVWKDAGEGERELEAEKSLSIAMVECTLTTNAVYRRLDFIELVKLPGPAKARNASGKSILLHVLLACINRSMVSSLPRSLPRSPALFTAGTTQLVRNRLVSRHQIYPSAIDPDFKIQDLQSV